MHLEKETLIVGSLHSRIACYIPISSRDSSTWIMLAFSKYFLPPPSSYSCDIEPKYIFERMGEDSEELGEVIQTSTVPRFKATLACASNTGAYLVSSEEKRAQAWCFYQRRALLVRSM